MMSDSESRPFTKTHERRSPARCRHKGVAGASGVDFSHGAHCELLGSWRSCCRGVLYPISLFVLERLRLAINLDHRLFGYFQGWAGRTRGALHRNLSRLNRGVYISQATVLFFEWQSDTPYQLFTAGGVSALFLLTFVFIIVRLVTSPTPSIAERILGLSSLLILTAGIAGFAFGTVTKYSGGLRYDIFLKDGEMVDVRLVLFTSHHAVFYSSDRVIILPTSDIVKIVARPRQ